MEELAGRVAVVTGGGGGIGEGLARAAAGAGMKVVAADIEADNAELADQIRERLKLYGQNKPYREVRNAGGRGNTNSH